MKGSAVGRLIWKDWQMGRVPILITMVWGAAALCIVPWGSQSAIVTGGVLFFIPLILMAHMLPLVGIGNERKNKNLAFLMSLPISSIQYTTSKLISSLLIFLIPWVTLVSAAVLLVEIRGVVPRGSIPVLMILAFMPVIGFCLITGACLVGESEGWGIAANVFCSSTYGLTWYFMTQTPALMANVTSPRVVWSSTSVTVLATEVSASVLLLGLTYFLQSRKRDFT
ncbi:MAG: ABC-2 transporter permease [Acidobacteriia bacterium]|nr:ABC-2 transporter permease [Terriglobia bacterium]